MFDQELFEKIVSLKCSEEELEAFCIDIDQKEFDTENAFTKYYCFDYILHCITLYQNKKISQAYLTYWANAYNWIIMGGFKDDCVNEPVTLKVLLKWEISDWLDSLSFFDKKYCDIKDYIVNFQRLDYLYQTAVQWRMFYAVTDAEIIDVSCLLINDLQKQYDFFDMNGFFTAQSKIDGNLCDQEEFDRIKKQLRQNGYIEL